jgi:hypothetical protein
VAKRLSQGRNATIPPFLSFAIDLRNYAALRKYRRATKAGLLRELESQHNNLFAYVNELADEELDRRGAVFGLGQMSTFEYLRRAPEHARDHGTGIRKALSA